VHEQVVAQHKPPRASLREEEMVVVVEEKALSPIR